jgi:hypothetical protein
MWERCCAHCLFQTSRRCHRSSALLHVLHGCNAAREPNRAVSLSSELWTPLQRLETLAARCYALSQARPLHKCIASS